MRLATNAANTSTPLARQDPTRLLHPSDSSAATCQHTSCTDHCQTCQSWSTGCTVLLCICAYFPDPYHGRAVNATRLEWRAAVACGASAPVATSLSISFPRRFSSCCCSTPAGTNSRPQTLCPQTLRCSSSHRPSPPPVANITTPGNTGNTQHSSQASLTCAKQLSQLLEAPTAQAATTQHKQPPASCCQAAAVEPSNPPQAASSQPQLPHLLINSNWKRRSSSANS